MRWIVGAAVAVLLATPLLTLPAAADFRGHGGPIRALAVSADGSQILSGSFDTTAILWSRDTGAAVSVLRSHDESVNTVALLPGGGMVTGGQDGRIVVWNADGEPRELGRHGGPVASLVLSADSRPVASASGDGTARLTPLDGSAYRSLTGHQGNVNAVAFLPDGRAVTAGYDATLRIWPLQDGPAEVIPVNAPLNALAVMSDGTIVAAGVDGRLRIRTLDGALREIETAPVPVTALAISPDEATIASAAIDGSIWLVDRASGSVRLTLQGADSPVWSLAFDPDDGSLFAGGGDRVIRQWDAATGERLNRTDAGETIEDFGDSRGAQVFAACQACHTLSEDAGNRAGPTLHGIFGRRIGTAEGYNYSEALKGMDIVWTPETVSELFDVGPNHYTPGTKMPEQRITDPADRAALMEFLEERTR